MDKYSAKEISLATGMSESTVRYRLSKLKVKTPCDYETVKQILMYRSSISPGPRPRAISDLKLKLKNDGFRIAEK